MSQPENLQTLYSAEQISKRLLSLSQEIAAGMPKNFAAIAILKGSFVFAADLVRTLHERQVNPDVDFMTLASYGTQTKSSGTVQLLRDAEIEVEGRHILLIDDILDSGRTLTFAKRHLLQRGAAAVKVCVLLDKTGSDPAESVEGANFVGFSCPRVFVTGYGMDYAHKFRGLPYVAILNEPSI